ncbi:Gcv operon activator [Hartmannibacter diazotrophicus]|uniref:Gcv operon activator n=1 Tax=Hartmannibacter diazotrophicus TaxID=1482074 RepID=A0A2C9DAU5_9HYPH|nr:LysR substrate-binding domain-containing protein [Hartmannibacter diazotrophicus]SON56725.1 Gcv operon activator [Hartmannibacter diazotrophicus]
MNERTIETLVDRLLSVAPLLKAIAEEGSFAGAADRLDLDPSAVSHRIRALERLLGLTLFERTTRRVVPTRSGAILCDASRDVVSELTRALAAAREVRRLPTIRLSVMSSLAMKWLVPRLPLAREAGIDVSVEIMEGLVELGHAGVDAALRFGVGPYPGLHSRRLLRCSLQPVVAPSLVRKNAAPMDPLVPDGLLLLGDTGSGRWSGLVAWETYARGLGRTIDPAVSRQDFDRADVMLQAAIGGLGIALGRTLLIEDDIANGLLVPIGPPVPIDASYWLVTSHEQAGSEAIEALARWLSGLLSTAGPDGAKAGHL